MLTIMNKVPFFPMNAITINFTIFIITCIIRYQFNFFFISIFYLKFR